MKKLFYLVMLTGVLFIAGCNQSVEEQAKDTVEMYMKAVENEELEKVVGMLAENHKYEMPELMFETLFENAELDYEIESMTVVSTTDNEVVIEVIQTTKKISGPDYIVNNRVTATHTLVKEDGELKFLDTEYSNGELLN